VKIIQHLKHLGEGVCEIQCERCERAFYFDLQNEHNNGAAVCPLCGLSERIKDLAGLYFVQVNYEGGSGGVNWQCGKCGCEFIFHNGETEESIICPNCHHKKSQNNATQEIIIEETAI